MSKDPARPRPHADGPPLPSLPSDFGPTPVPKVSQRAPTPEPQAPSARLVARPPREEPGGLDPVLLLLAALGGGLAALLVAGLVVLGILLT